jgi:hypothetical protein
MRLSNLNDLQLQSTADSMRLISSRMIDPAALEELIDRRAAMSPMCVAEMSFAYERASGVIESHCATAYQEGDDYTYYDLATAGIEDLEDEVAYLESRKLILRHRENPNWVAICDEGEPLGEVA